MCGFPYAGEIRDKTETDLHVVHEPSNARCAREAIAVCGEAHATVAERDPSVRVCQRGHIELERFGLYEISIPEQSDAIQANELNIDTLLSARGIQFSIAKLPCGGRPPRRAGASTHGAATTS